MLASLASIYDIRNMPRSAKENYTPTGVMVVVDVVVIVITRDEMAAIVVVAKVVDMLCRFLIISSLTFIQIYIKNF